MNMRNSIVGGGTVLYYQLISVLIPVFMISFGFKWQNNAPHKPNTLHEFGIGYKSILSIKSQETWNYSHKYIGKIYLAIGIVLLITSSILWCYYDYYRFPAKIILLIQLSGLWLPVIPTEAALKRNFDENGNKMINS